ncbi:MAG: hypothetical protein ACJAVF_003075, partial [Paraglaciecola sp.]
ARRQRMNKPLVSRCSWIRWKEGVLTWMNEWCGAKKVWETFLME